MKPTTLQIAVIKQLGYCVDDLENDTDDGELWGILKDVDSHSADAGWSGFTYYHDTIRFTKENRKEIEKLIRQCADDFGTKPDSLICSFNCLDGKDGAIKEAAGRFVYGGHYKDSKDCDSQSVYNALAWFALEETAHQLVND